MSIERLFRLRRPTLPDCPAAIREANNKNKTHSDIREIINPVHKKASDVVEKQNPSKSA